MRDQRGIKSFMLSYTEELPKTVPNSLGVLQRLPTERHAQPL
jgi:hypothetical protein